MYLSPNEHFDTVIIGAGMSGLAAGIRLALFNHNVVILERHYAPGGLNSFYTLEGRKYDVGLHALTNFAREGVKKVPLVRLLRQLRIARSDFGLCEQRGSRVAFPGVDLRFSNDFALIESEVEQKFPGQIDGFQKLVRRILDFDELAFDRETFSARRMVKECVTDALLEDMIFCPLMYYGSATEGDMDFGQFVVMFKAIFREGFSRPFEGVRQIIRVLRDRYKVLGGKRAMRCGVKRIVTEGGRVARLELDRGISIRAENVISSVGLVETLRLCDDQPNNVAASDVGRLSFVETISILDRQPKDYDWNDTIVFFNDSERFVYARPKDLVDPRSGVICFPNNYHYEDGMQLEEGVLRITAIANYDRWMSLDEEEYLRAKDIWFEKLRKQVSRFLSPLNGVGIENITVDSDMFTPRTIEHFTGHLSGAVYGAARKINDGRTHLKNLFICGTDQGFLGVMGAILSGISMANYHILIRKSGKIYD